MKKILAIILIIICAFPVNIRAETIDKLNAKYAVLMDGDTHRVLYGKNEDTQVPMASTTKIMTLIVALEYGNEDFIATVSKYASSMPDVQLNAVAGENYALKDLYYSLMLKSHNDTAVIIAENIANIYFNVNCDLSKISTTESKELVAKYISLMNDKARSLGCEHTNFITPNGLDSEDESGVHSTTAIDLAKIMSYCIQNDKFLEITQASSHTFHNKVENNNHEFTNGSKTYTVSNANAFLHMMDGVISGKTGFTGNAGYCYVGALKRDDKTYIIALMACGWPPNKSYKWSDARKLFNYGINNFRTTTLLSPINNLKEIKVLNGTKATTNSYIIDSVSALISDSDNINVVYNLNEEMEAPIKQGKKIGSAKIFINDELFSELPIYASDSVTRIDYWYCLRNILKQYLIS